MKYRIALCLAALLASGDKKRVLLMSEDGRRWHCYDFQRLRQD